MASNYPAGVSTQNKLFKYSNYFHYLETEKVTKAIPYYNENDKKIYIAISFTLYQGDIEFEDTFDLTEDEICSLRESIKDIYDDYFNAYEQY